MLVCCMGCSRRGAHAPTAVVPSHPPLHTPTPHVTPVMTPPIPGDAGVWVCPWCDVLCWCTGVTERSAAVLPCWRVIRGHFPTGVGTFGEGPRGRSLPSVALLEVGVWVCVVVVSESWLCGCCQLSGSHSGTAACRVRWVCRSTLAAVRLFACTSRHVCWRVGMASQVCGVASAALTASISQHRWPELLSITVPGCTGSVSQVHLTDLWSVHCARAHYAIAAGRVTGMVTTRGRVLCRADATLGSRAAVLLACSLCSVMGRSRQVCGCGTAQAGAVGSAPLTSPWV